MHDLLARLLKGLGEPVVALVEPTKRVFVPFLLGAALLAAIVWALRLRRRVSLVRFLFPRKIWLHPSALLDYRLMFARAVLQTVLLGPYVLTATGTAVLVGAELRLAFGPGPRWDVGHTTVIALFSVLAFLADDLGRWLVHMLAHRVPALWELHKVHHSAEVLTPFTVYRTHPFESVLMRSGAALGVGVVAGLMSFFFRGPITGWAILGVDAFSLLWNALGSNLRHSHVWISYGRVLEHVLISPAQHQIHHSEEPRHFHTNFGATFAFWDWIGRSLYVTRGRERLRFGLPPDELNHGPTVLSAWFAPLLRIVRPRPRRAGAASRVAPPTPPAAELGGRA
jgi:sterol desaturase/sphingolipid hydroxylase (fatty acid hydroxylase superfamily)